MSSERPIWIGLGGLLIAALAAWPFRDAWLSGGIPGAGPDVESTTWGLWWFQQSWTGPAWGAESLLANFPLGVRGSVLGLSGALTWAVSDPLLGPELAASLVTWSQLGLLAAAVGWLAHRAGLSTPAATCAALSLLVGRVLGFDAGEASVVAVAALPLPLGIAASLRRGPWAALGLAACITWLAVENPYLTLALPVVGAATLMRDRDPWRVGGLVLGALGVLGVMALFQGTSDPAYPPPMHFDGQDFRLGPWTLTAADLPWSRASLVEWVWPGSVAWTTGVMDAESASGGGYLGWSVLLLAGLGTALRPRQAWPWMALAGGALVLSLGSVPGGPFLALNALMDVVARPLTQPSRFVVVALVGLAVPVGLAVEALREKASWAGFAVLGVLLVDAAAFGAGRLRAPVTHLPDATCITELDGPVLLWPAGGSPDGYDGPARLHQMRHEQPSPHRGIASWVREGSAYQALGTERFDARAVHAQGIDWVLALPGVSPPRGLGSAAIQCEGYQAFELE